MTTLKNIVEALSTLDDISRLNATIGGWTIEIGDWDWKHEREISFKKPLQNPTEAEMKEMRETVGDD